MSAKWTFFTNHGHVIFILNLRKDVTVLDIANEVGITERAARGIIADLARDEYITIQKEGRKNTYKINKSKKLKHEIEKNCSVGALLKLIKSKTS